MRLEVNLEFHARSRAPVAKRQRHNQGSSGVLLLDPPDLSCNVQRPSLMASKPLKDAEGEVKSWGFNHVFTWTDGPNAYYPPHSQQYHNSPDSTWRAHHNIS